MHTGVMRPALRRYAECSMLQHAARRSYAGCCRMHAYALHTPVCRLQPESLGCIRLHLEKCTWLVATCKCFNTWVGLRQCLLLFCTVSAVIVILLLSCYCYIVAVICAKFINKIKINKCCSRPHGRHGVRHGLD